MGRPSNRDQRRAEIVQGLLKAIARQGYERATIAEIAREAGLAPGLMHYHFKSKREILLALMDELWSAVRTRVERRLTGTGESPRERLLAFVDAYVALGDDADQSSVAAWVVLGSEALRDADVRRLYEAAARKTLKQLERLVGAALRKGSKSSTRQISAAILSMIEGAYRISATSPGLLPKGFAAPMLHKAIDGLLGSESRS